MPKRWITENGTGHLGLLSLMFRSKDASKCAYGIIVLSVDRTLIGPVSVRYYVQIIRNQ